MNAVCCTIPEEAREAALCCLFLYLAHKITPKDCNCLRTAVTMLEYSMKNDDSHQWSSTDAGRLYILKNAVEADPVLGSFTIKDLTLSDTGLTACIFVKPNGDIIAAYKGTGSGEWIDNGEGLSGIPEENTYISYGSDGKPAGYRMIHNDYASDQQAEALNWFNKTAAVNGWNENNRIVLAGHSKGGNKAQFVTIHSGLADICWSFNGQGFSPEAINAMEKQYGEDFQKRRQKLYSISADNDFVNVLGKRLVPDNQTYWLEGCGNPHQLEAILTPSGELRPETVQGRLSEYVEGVSDELMGIDPAVRRYAALGIMNIFHRHYSKDSSEDEFSLTAEETIAGISVTIGAVLRQFRKAINERNTQ